MSIILSVISLILVVVIQLLLQLTPATFSIFYHYALGKYRSKKADDLALNFIFGVELFNATIWLSVYFVIYAIFINLPDFHHGIILWILAGITVAEAIVFFCCYFRRIKSRNSASTALFIPRHFAANLSARAEHIKNKKDAFTLGFFVGVPELIFTLPLFIIADLILTNSLTFTPTIVIILAVLAMTIPLFAIRTAFRSGSSLAILQRFRAHAKPVIRFLATLLLLALSATLIGLELL